MNATGTQRFAARSSAPGAIGGLGLFRLAWLQAAGRRRRAAGLGLCLFVTLAVPTLLPVLDGIAFERALQATVSRDGSLTVEQQVGDVDAFGDLQRRVTAQVQSRMGGAMQPLAASASTGPLYPTTLNGDPAPSATSGRQLRAAYVDGLAAHVEVLAGELPPDGLGGDDTAVTLSRAGADLVDINLFDRLCLGFAAGDGSGAPSRWCARVVGLWQPLDLHDPFWGGRNPDLELALGRYDYFKLTRNGLPAGTLARVSFLVDPAAVDSSSAGPFEQQLSALLAGLQGRDRRVVTNLASRLREVMDEHAAVTGALRLFTAVATLAGLVVAGLVAVRFAGEQAPLLSILRARGFPRGRTWLVAFLGLAAPAIYGLPFALAACLLVLALAASRGAPGGIASLASPQTQIALLTCGVVAALLVLLLAVLAGAALRTPLRASLEPPVPSPSSARTRLGLAALAGLLGAGSLALARLPALGGVPAPGLQLALGLLPALAALGLGFAAAALLPSVTVVLRGNRSLPRLLTRWQLERATGQHVWISLALTLASAGAAFAAVVLLSSQAGGGTVLDPALSEGLAESGAVGFLGVLLLAAAGTAAHYSTATRWRLRDYSGLFAQGLTGRQLRASLALEQALTSVWAVLVGGFLGVLLALAALGTPSFSWSLVQLASAVAAVLGLLLAAVLAVGARTRRLPDRLELLRPEGEG